jgi:hypothetical protein
MPEKTAEELAAEAAAEAANKKKKVTFDEEQTAFVNLISSRSFADGAEKVKKEYEERLATEKAEREKLAAEKAELEQKLAAAAGLPKKEETPTTPEQKPAAVKLEELPEWKQMQARFEEMNTIFQGVKQERDTLKAQQEKDRAERRKSRKKDKFLSALGKANVSFFDPLEAYELAEREGLEYDEDKDAIVVKNAATGQPKLNENGEPMNEVDFVKDFATRKKYLVKSQEPGGLGQGETEKLTTSTAPVKDWSKATKEELEAERQRILSQPRS